MLSFLFVSFVFLLARTSNRRAQESLRWSPWFIGIMDRGGWDWWGRLEEALRKDGPLAKEEIIYFDPPPAHHAAYNPGRKTMPNQGSRARPIFSARFDIWQIKVFCMHSAHFEFGAVEQCSNLVDIENAEN